VNRSVRGADRPISDTEIASLFASFPTSGRIIVAVSGGADSTALMVLAQRWSRSHAAAELVAATVDHGLRAQSGAEAEAVGALAARLGLRHERLVWEGRKPATGIEAAARRVRYRLLGELARRLDASHVATAHTLDDQAETVLMRLAAGSGPAGLAGMRPAETHNGFPLLRPFLTTPKARLVATLQRDGIGWSEDPMNTDVSFARPRLRAASAALEREGLTAERLGRLAERMTRHEAVVAAAAEAARTAVRRQDHPGCLDGAALIGLPEELALRVLAAEIAQIGSREAEDAANPIRLKRLEALWQDLRPAIKAGRSARRTLAGALISVESDRSVVITREPARRSVSKRSAKPLTTRQRGKGEFTERR
jgi:tRNA(Ile)-lysidine synthase